MIMKTTVGKEIWLDPTEDEAKAGSSSLVLACMPALGVVTNVWQNGRMTPQEGLEVCVLLSVANGCLNLRFIQCMNACQERCSTIHSIVSQALLDVANTT